MRPQFENSGNGQPNHDSPATSGANRTGQQAGYGGAAGFGMLTQAESDEWNKLYHNYFSGLENKYGINDQQLVQAFQQNKFDPATAQKLNAGFDTYTNNYFHPDSLWDKIAQKIALTGTVAAISGGVGAGVGSAAGLGLGSVAGGAAAGATASLANSGLTGSAVTLGGVAKGAVTGAATAGLGQLAGGASKYLTDAGMNSTVANGLVSTGAKAIGGGLSAGLNGQDIGQGIVSGAERGAINAGTGAVTGSIFNSGSSIFNSGSTDVQSQNPNLTNPTAPSTMDFSQAPVMDNYGFDPSTLGNVDTGSMGPVDPGNSYLNNLDVQGGGSTLGGGYSDANGNTTIGNLTGSALSKFLGGMAAGGSQVGGGNSSLLGKLAGLFGGSGGGGSLAQLLGLGVNAGAGYFNHQAATDAAKQYAGQTQFSPYSINTNGGSTSFDGKNATSSLSPQQQQASNNLSAIGNQASQNLQAGPQAASQGYFNQLQAADKDANNKFYQNNLDNQFGNGVLSSTAGQYQSQAALGAINQHTLQNQVLANQFGQNQQQNQLGQLTASLNGNNQINQQQLAQLGLGGNLGGEASNANLQAFKPLAGANTTSNFGQLLSSIGNQYNNGNQNLYPTQQTGP